MNMINLTLYTICVVDAKNNIVGEYPSQGVARVVTREERIKEDGVDIVRTVFGGVEGLPKPKGDNIYIVSTAVELAVLQERTDVVAPDTGASSVKRRKYRIIEKRP